MRAVLRDRVRVTIRGAAPERVVSACAAQGIRLRNVTPVEDYALQASISAFQVGNLKRIAEKYQCEVERVQITRFGRAVRKGSRCRLLALLLAAAGLLAWLSSLFVWEIRVVGNETVSTAAILRALDDCGVTVGTFWPKMNIDLVRSGVQRRVPGLEWFTVNLRGSVAEVRVTERVEAPEIMDNDAPYELYADHSGVVVHMEVLQGQPLVQRGDFVTAGQVLVSGVPEDVQGERHGVHALGSVRVRTAYCLTARLPLQTRSAQPNGRTHTRWSLLLGKKRVNFGKSSSIPGAVCDKIYSVYVCAIPGLVQLPFRLLREDVTPLSFSETETDADAARAQLEQALTDALRQRIGPDGEVISQHFTPGTSGGVYTLTLRCECEQEIAAEQPCLISDTPYVTDE
ncbi:MAG: sporulation protein YqfD [Oscillospiraceae bacterium]|nr:sporulation protein YqfD [Oscillospiraceae bacterium]